MRTVRGQAGRVAPAWCAAVLLLPLAPGAVANHGAYDPVYVEASFEAGSGQPGSSNGAFVVCQAPHGPSPTGIGGACLLGARGWAGKLKNVRVASTTFGDETPFQVRCHDEFHNEDGPWIRLTHAGRYTTFNGGPACAYLTVAADIGAVHVYVVVCDVVGWSGGQGQCGDF